jgi:regulator of replication initiation timing
MKKKVTIPIVFFFCLLTVIVAIGSSANKHVDTVKENVTLKFENIGIKGENAKLKVENSQLKETVNKLQDEIQVKDTMPAPPLAPQKAIAVYQPIVMPYRAFAGELSDSTN